MNLLKISPLIVAVALIFVLASSSGTQASQHGVTGESTQSRLNQLNYLSFDLSYAVWKLTYNSVKQNAGYDWMAWANDGCSVPSIIGYRDVFANGCLRHDLVWRSLGVLDEATGQVWNERNRLAADHQFKADNTAECDERWAHNPAGGITCYFYVELYFSGVRSWAKYRHENNAETASVLNNKRYIVTNRGGYVSGSGTCSYTTHPNNRCLPIIYLEYGGKPFSPQKYIYPGQPQYRIPLDSVLEVKVVYANIHSVKGPPTSAGYVRRTGAVRVRAHDPISIANSSRVNCRNYATEVHKGSTGYSTSTSARDHILKKSSAWVKMCGTTSSSDHTTKLIEIHPVIAVYNNNLAPGYDSRVRDYEDIRILNFRAKLETTTRVNPDGAAFSHSASLRQFKLDTGPYLDRANVRTTHPLVRLSGNQYSTGLCTRPELFDLLQVRPDNANIYIAMCGTGDGEVTIEDPETGFAVTTYSDIDGPDCREEYGSLAPRFDTTGSWSFLCSSQNRRTSYARFYTFYLSARSEVSVTVQSSEEDSYLFLLDGRSTTSNRIALSDNGIPGTKHAKVTRTLGAGWYTVEATTRDSYTTGNFALTIQQESVSLDPPTGLFLSAVSGRSDRLSLAYTRSGSPSHYYQFSLERLSRVTDNYGVADTRNDSLSPALFTSVSRGYAYRVRGRNCPDSTRSAGCGDWGNYSNVLEFSDPQVALSGVPASLQADTSHTIGVNATDLIRSQQYTVTRTTDDDGLGFNSGCAQNASWSFTTANNFRSFNFTLYACDEPGGKVAVQLREGGASGTIVASASSEDIQVTVPTVPGPSNPQLSTVTNRNSQLRLDYGRSGNVYNYELQLYQRNPRFGSFALYDTVRSGQSHTIFNSVPRGYWYKARGRNCADASRTVGCSSWGDYSPGIEFSDPSVSLSGLRTSLVAETSDGFSVNLSDLTIRQPYHVGLSTDDDGMGFDVGCGQSVSRIFTPTTTSQTLSFDFYACDTPGGSVTAELRKDSASGTSVASASASVTVTPVPNRSPEFDSASYSADVGENAGQNTEVLTVVRHRPR